MTIQRTIAPTKALATKIGRRLSETDLEAITEKPIAAGRVRSHTQRGNRVKAKVRRAANITSSDATYEPTHPLLANAATYPA